MIGPRSFVKFLEDMRDGKYSPVTPAERAAWDQELAMGQEIIRDLEADILLTQIEEQGAEL